MKAELELLQFANRQVYPELRRAKLPDSREVDDLDDDAINEENDLDFLCFEIVLPEATGTNNQLNLAADAQPAQSKDTDWLIIERAVKDEVSEYGSRIPGTDSSRASIPTNTNDPIEKLNQFADSVFKEGRSDPKLRSWLVPPSLDKLRAQVVSLTGLNKIKEQWRYKDFFPSSFEPESDNSSEEQTDEEKMPTELLYDILANRMCPAKEHHAFLQLSGFKRIPTKDIKRPSKKDIKSSSKNDIESSPKNDIVFNLFLSCCCGSTSQNETEKWHKTTCTLERSEPPEFANRKPVDICSKFPLHCRRRTPLRLSFNKDKSWDTLNSLDDQSPGEQSSRSLSSFEELKTDVKLETLLQENHLQTTDPEDILRKFRLAFRLASSLHQLYPGPWIHQEWSASLLYIVQAPETRPIEMLYETYVSCVLRKDWRDRISFPEVYPEYCETEICPRFFLSLAQLLVELAKGESDGRFSGELKSEEWYDMLFDELKMRFFRDKLMESYRKAIEGCLFYLQNYNTEAQRTPDEKLRAQSVILQNIVLPLKKNIKVWGSRDHQIQGIGDSFTAGIGSPSGMGARPFTISEYELWSSGDDKHSEKIEEKNPDRSTSENMFTTKMKTFLRSHIEELPESTGGDASGKKVRIAIIDTGFFQDDQDGEDTELLQFVDQGRIKEKRNFFQPIDLSGLEDPDPEPDPDDWEDHHGHGTHVARILLRFAPRAEIVVAKITNTRSLKTTNITQLVKALKWAGEHADIINMSFGLRVTHIQELDDQIARLVGARKLVFAAASNTGGNGSRSWPATQPGVFCIHAMNEFATDVPGMNPTPLEMEHNFAVLGHEIESHWDGKKISISGTSFASPIAAAIAANVLEFTRCMMPETMDLFTTYKSMSGLFRYHMTANSDNSIYHNIMPWINDLWSPGNTAENVCKKLRRVAILGD